MVYEPLNNLHHSCGLSVSMLHITVLVTTGLQIDVFSQQNGVMLTHSVSVWRYNIKHMIKCMLLQLSFVFFVNIT